MYLIDTRKYDDSFLLAKILEKVDITDEEKKKLFKHFEKPEVVDAVPVIRCKDCEFSSPPDWGWDEVYCTKHNNWFKNNGYCHLGRREDAKTDRCL